MATFIVWIAIWLMAWGGETFCCALAYKIDRGQKGLGISVPELLWRSASAAFFFSLVAAGGLVLGSYFGYGIEVCYVAGVLFLPIGAQVINMAFELDDWLKGVGIYLLRIVPLFLLAVPLALFGVVHHW